MRKISHCGHLRSMIIDRNNACALNSIFFQIFPQKIANVFLIRKPPEKRHESSFAKKKSPPANSRPRQRLSGRNELNIFWLDICVAKAENNRMVGKKRVVSDSSKRLFL